MRLTKWLRSSRIGPDISIGEQMDHELETSSTGGQDRRHIKAEDARHRDGRTILNASQFIRCRQHRIEKGDNAYDSGQE